jgi:hypothetical protein
MTSLRCRMACPFMTQKHRILRAEFFSKHGLKNVKRDIAAVFIYTSIHPNSIYNSSMISDGRWRGGGGVDSSYRSAASFSKVMTIVIRTLA